MTSIKLMQGDCLDRMREIEGGSVDMVCADPPYQITSCAWDSIIPLEPMWEHLKRVIKPNGAIAIMAAQPFTTILIYSNIKMFKYCWVWEKSQAVGHLNAYKMPMKNTEDICVFYRKQCIYNPELACKLPENIRPETNMRKISHCYGAHSKESTRKIPPNKTLPNQIIRFNNCQDHLHPTQKPVALMEYLIKTYTNEGDTVLDFAMGSGTTGVACKNLNRNFIGIELDKDYFELAKKRIENTQVQQALPLGGAK